VVECSQRMQFFSVYNLFIYDIFDERQNVALTKTESETLLLARNHAYRRRELVDYTTSSNHAIT